MTNIYSSPANTIPSGASNTPQDCCTLFVYKHEHMKLTCSSFTGLILLLLVFPAMAQETDSVVLKTATGDIYGTLGVPVTKMPVPVALIIAGSGPTDRDGNNPMMKNNSLKFLADTLNKLGIATLRYDKRGIAASKNAMKKETDIRFNMLVDDAAALIKQLKADKRFSKVIVVGHSEGSTIGLQAASMSGADAMISIAGPGKPADKILRDQLNASLDPAKAINAEAAAQMKQSRELANLFLDTLSRGTHCTILRPVWARCSVLPFNLISSAGSNMTRSS